MNKSSIYFPDEALRSSGWLVPSHTYDCLSNYEKDFLKTEFTGVNSLNYYICRLQELGLEATSSVLDAGCGMGQWSIALSRLNNHVTGTDINVGRLLAAKDISDAMNITNVEFKYSSAESSPFADNSFDVVFCYGVFMFTNMPEALAEYFRILKPGGKIYLNVNSFGWYLHLLIDRGFKRRNISMVKTSLSMLNRSLLRKQRNVMVSPSRLKQ